MMRQKLCPYIFVLNNDGYEIEKQIHGPERWYNDIQVRSTFSRLHTRHICFDAHVELR